MHILRLWISYIKSYTYTAILYRYLRLYSLIYKTCSSKCGKCLRIIKLYVTLKNLYLDLEELNSTEIDDDSAKQFFFIFRSITNQNYNVRRVHNTNSTRISLYTGIKQRDFKSTKYNIQTYFSNLISFVQRVLKLTGYNAKSLLK